MKNIISLVTIVVILSFSQCSDTSGETKHKDNTTPTEENPISSDDNSDSSNENPIPDDESNSPAYNPLASRTSGVAPLAVHFFSDFVHSAPTDERSDRFHHYDYTWDFGDAGSGTWSTTGKSKNTAKGTGAVHIFENPGQYRVTLTIRNHSGIAGTENYIIDVSDPDTVYSGNRTTCVNNAGDNDFSGAPDGARRISTDNLSTVVQYATAGCRVLFKRGSSWTITGLNWPSSQGPVTIGAYGTGTSPDAQGIYENAPVITVNRIDSDTNGIFMSITNKRDWRILDLHLIDSSKTNNTVSGIAGMQRILLNRLKIDGFSAGITWSHANDAELRQKDEMVVASCDISGCGSYGIYCGGERLALLGNIVKDIGTQHVLRVWQGYRSVISHNVLSGASITSHTGLHALKLHGPGVYPGHEGTDTYGQVPAVGNGMRKNRTEYTIVSDNTFGASGPWPVAIGPQNNLADERLSDIIFERNQIHSQYGTQSSPVTISLILELRNSTVRNNIIDGTGSANDYAGVYVTRRGVEPDPCGIEVYNNTVYSNDTTSGGHAGFYFDSMVTSSMAKNNLASFPNVTGLKGVIQDLTSGGLINTSNLFTLNAYFINPDDVHPLHRDFRLQDSSPALNQGASVPVYDDHSINTRPESSNDLGAFER